MFWAFNVLQREVCNRSMFHLAPYGLHIMDYCKEHSPLIDNTERSYRMPPSFLV